MSPERAQELRLLLSNIVTKTLSKKYLPKVSLQGAINIDNLLARLSKDEQVL